MKKETCDDEHCSFRIRTEEQPQENFCRKYNKPIKDVGFCAKKFNGGWISPEGEFFSSDFGSHNLDAEEIIEKKFPIIYERLKDKWRNENKKFLYLSDYCKDKLVEKGWVDLTGNPLPLMGFTEHIWAVCISENKVTPQQHDLIKKFIKQGMRFAGFSSPTFPTLNHKQNK